MSTGNGSPATRYVCAATGRAAIRPDTAQPSRPFGCMGLFSEFCEDGVAGGGCRQREIVPVVLPFGCMGLFCKFAGGGAGGAPSAAKPSHPFGCMGLFFKFVERSVAG